MLRLVQRTRTHWKKSLLLVFVSYYGAGLALDKLRQLEVMNKFCRKISAYGDELLAGRKLQKVLVILNPAAKFGKSSKAYERNVHPLLSLSGLLVDTVRTESEGHAKDYVRAADLQEVEFLVVVGGNGTLNEVVTGLMRRPDRERVKRLKIVVIPTGVRNSLFNELSPPERLLAETLCEATMRMLEGTSKPVDVVQVSGSEGDPIYSLSGLSLGVYDSIFLRLNPDSMFYKIKKYWNLGKCVASGAYATDYTLSLRYSDPCDGCAVCKPVRVITSSWWNRFSKSKGTPPRPWAVEVKDTCANLNKEARVKCSQFGAKIHGGGLLMGKYSNLSDWRDFVGRGARWDGQVGDRVDVCNCLDLNVDEIPGGVEFNIDGESFPARNVRITLLRDQLTFLF